jgi:hypothetical protein
MSFLIFQFEKITSMIALGQPIPGKKNPETCRNFRFPEKSCRVIVGGGAERQLVDE